MKTKVNAYYRKPYHINVTGKTSLWDKTVSFIKTLVRIVIILAVLALTHTIAYYAGSKFNPKIVEVHTVESTPAVLVRIAQAESMSSHYCTEKLVSAKMCYKTELGQVLMNANKNGTVDIGKYQINTYYWGNAATELGLDVSNEADNEAMALWIYENYGTDPWEASSKNW